MRFLDEAIIDVRAGNGGNGAVSFRREKFIPRGGPDGGDGGSGGDVVFVADAQMSTLLDFKYKKHFTARNGERGRGKQQSGKSADDLLIKIPVGTVLFDAESGEMLVDVLSDGERFVAAKGGHGGKGNMNFATATRQAPAFAMPGGKAETRQIRLELKLLADVGIIGLPNAGKSTLISRISNARPKIADYPFTTLVPNLGVVRGPGNRDFVVADMPGLIAGAHEGIGLGFRFLKHIERCKMLLFLVEPCGGEGRNPFSDFETTERELRLYGGDMADRPSVIVLSKRELLSDAEVKKISAKFKKTGRKYFAISAVTGAGIDMLVSYLAGTVDEIRRESDGE